MFIVYIPLKLQQLRHEVWVPVSILTHKNAA